MGHLYTDCTLLATGAVRAPVSATLPITDDRQGKAESSNAKGRAYQLTDEEARAAPDVVIIMYPFTFLLIFPYFMLMFMFVTRYIPSVTSRSRMFLISR